MSASANPDQHGHDGKPDVRAVLNFDGFDPTTRYLSDVAFCPICGEPAARRVRGDRYECRYCGRRGELTGWG